MLSSDPTSPISRRNILRTASLAATAALTPGALAEDAKSAAGADGPAATKGRIKQSLVSWCYTKHFGNEEGLAKAAKNLGCVSVELIDPQHWDMLKKYGVTSAIGRSHGFTQGMNNPKYQEKCIAALHASIDRCAEAGIPSIITFTGMREDIPDDVGMDNCVKGYKQVMSHAEKKGINLCLEMLNSRHGKGFMQGHPGYQGDHTDYCIELIKRVGSERMKILFDIYHVQIMDGDVIERIHQHKDYIGHVHTAGNPGRGELDDKQEINYKPIMQALVDIGYKGFVGQEFIPTRDPMQGLREAMALCDV